jgi:hypothetical protein
MAERLQELGWEPEEFGKDGIPTLDDETCSSCCPGPRPSCWPSTTWCRSASAPSRRQGSVAQHERNGRIHGEVNTCGTPTARMTHQHPNVAQVPRSPAARLARSSRTAKSAASCSSPRTARCSSAATLTRWSCATSPATWPATTAARTSRRPRRPKEDGTDMHSVNARALGCSARHREGLVLRLDLRRGRLQARPDPRRHWLGWQDQAPPARRRVEVREEPPGARASSAKQCASASSTGLAQGPRRAPHPHPLRALRAQLPAAVRWRDPDEACARHPRRRAAGAGFVPASTTSSSPTSTTSGRSRCSRRSRSTWARWPLTPSARRASTMSSGAR